MHSSQPISSSRSSRAGAGRGPRAQAIFLLVALAASAAACGGRSDLLEEAGADGVAGACVPAPEVCDGRDNDCDGVADEGCACVEGQQRSCYSGPQGTLGVGVCTAGVQVCSRSAWGPCTGDRTPAPETCDLLDNDCDGQTDESTCPAGTVCAASLTADMTSPPEGWSFNGTAFWDPDTRTGVLTEPMYQQAGTIVYRNPIAADAFTVTFELRLGSGDGMGFMLQTLGDTAVGEPGGGLAMAGLDGYGVEFDTYNNFDCSDWNDNHIAVDVLSQPCPEGVLSSFVDAATNVALGDGAFHTARIELDAGEVSVSVDGERLLQRFPIDGFPVGSRFFHGFAGATGAAVARQEIRNVKISFPSPRCL